MSGPVSGRITEGFAGPGFSCGAGVNEASPGATPDTYSIGPITGTVGGQAWTMTVGWYSGFHGAGSYDVEGLSVATVELGGADYQIKNGTLTIGTGLHSGSINADIYHEGPPSVWGHISGQWGCPH